MPPDLLLLLIIMTVFLVPLLTPSGKWLWIASPGIFIFLSYQWVQSYLYRSNLDNKYGPGHMLGDIIGTIVTGAFFLGIIIRLIVWIAMKRRSRDIT